MNHTTKRGGRIAALIIATAALCAHARVGDTKYKCETRYGKGTKAAPIELCDKAYSYKVGGLPITCHFYRGKCVLIQIRTLSEETCKALRTANGEKWSKVGSKWHTADGKRVGVDVIGRLPGFMIYDAAFRVKLTKHRAKGKPKL